MQAFVNAVGNISTQSFPVLFFDELSDLISNSLYRTCDRNFFRRFTTLNFKNNIFSEIKSDGNLTASAYIPVTVGNLKRHSLKDYWKAGLGKVWDIPVIRELAEFVVCIEDMKYDLQELPKIFYEDNIEIDLVDDDIMHHLEEFTLEKLYK